MANNYIDNETLQKHFVSWKKEILKIPDYPNDVIEDRLKKAPMPEKIGEAILKVSHNFINDRRFNQYSDDWKDHMIGDAIVNCVKYLHSYDPDKWKNPHAYITKCCESAYIQRIKKENKKLITKYKFYTDNVFDMGHVDQGKVDYDFYLDMVGKIDDYETKQEAAKQKAKAKAAAKKKPKPNKGLDEFIDE